MSRKGYGPVLRQARRLEEHLAGLSNAIVAFSGGVDSSLLAYAARRVLGDRMVAAIGESSSLARRDFSAAKKFCRKHGIELRVVRPAEMEDHSYVANRPDRCYHCKKRLFSAMVVLAKKLSGGAGKAGPWTILDGANADDAFDYRPGLKGGLEKGVRSPFMELGLSKDDIRKLSRHYGLDTADKPASPCLSSRIPYGDKVTEAKLQSVEKAEDFLLGLGFRPCRVRHHGSVARVEILETDLPRAFAERRTISKNLRRAGFIYAALDLDGFRSGSLNATIKKP